jgi:hypothetical protein
VDQRRIKIVDAISQSQQFQVTHGGLIGSPWELLRERRRVAKHGKIQPYSKYPGPGTGLPSLPPL